MTGDEFFDESGDVPAPRGGLPETFKEKVEHEDETRRYVTYWLLGLLSVLEILAAAALVSGLITVEVFKELNVVIAPVVALTGTALGFYFGKSRK